MISLFNKKSMIRHWKGALFSSKAEAKDILRKLKMQKD